MTKRIMNLQYTGDYRNAYLRMKDGLGETYFGHRYILEGMGELGRDVGEVAMFCAITESAYDEVPENGLRLMGGGLACFDTTAVIEAIRSYAPSHLVLHTPERRIANWATSNGIRTMLVLADSFNRTRPIDRLRHFLLSRALNRQGIEWVANHGLKSCLSLQEIGIDPSKIIPWDYIYGTTPESYAPRTLERMPDPVELVYVGTIHESKGCGDIIRAVARLKARNLNVRLRLAGSGDEEEMRALARTLGLDAEVEFVGRIANDEVIDFFRTGHIALITSRHDYPEGFPLTIYEALTSRTPLVVSNHPMFTGNLVDGESAVIFEAGDSVSLATKILDVLSSSALYARLSENSAPTWHSLQVPAKWVDVIGRWVQGGAENQQWLHRHIISSPVYRERTAFLRGFMSGGIATGISRSLAREVPLP